MNRGDLGRVIAKARPGGETAAQAAAPRPAGVVVPAYKPFPVHALPPAMREFVAETAAALGCDPAFAALPALALAGAAVGNSLVALLKRKWREPPLLWAVPVADSGGGKTPGMEPSIEIAVGVNRRLAAEHLEKLKRYEADLAEWQAADDPDPGRNPAKPVREVFVIDDATVEALIVTAGESPHGLLMAREEVADWFGSFRRYQSKGGGSDVAKWLKSYGAGWTSYRRRTGEPREVECPRTFVAVCGGIQPGVLRDLFADSAYVASGLAARLLFAMPPKKCLRWSDDELSADTEARFRRVVHDLSGLPYDPRNGPTEVPLAADARELFKAVKNADAERAEQLDGGPMAAVLPKATGQAARLALIHHAVSEAAAGRDPGKSRIAAGSMAAGITLARWFVGEAERVYAMLAESPEDRADRSLVELIERREGRITVRELSRCNRPGLKTAAACEAALDGLVTAGRGQWVNTKNKSGRAVRYLELLPVDTSPADGPADGPDADPDGPG